MNKRILVIPKPAKLKCASDILFRLLNRSMSKERDLIRIITSKLPRSKDQLNDLFESDAEIINYGSKKLLVSIDEFSDEDNFRSHDPYTLGWNLAIATISDILASGGHPRFYAHSIIIDKNNWDDSYLDKFSAGIGEVLKKTGTSFIGGDMGSADKWGYTGVVLGETDKPVKRKGAKPGDIIFMTGKTGAGNLEAALKLYSEKLLLNKILKHYPVRFPCRIKESQIISRYATSCIDSSDGVLNALKTISELNKTGFEITEIPYIQNGILACKILSKPIELLLMGECGEYELVFTMDKKDMDYMTDEAKKQKLVFTCIGQITEEPSQILTSRNGRIDFTGFNICARDFTDVNLYLEALINFLKDYA